MILPKIVKQTVGTAVALSAGIVLLFAAAAVACGIGLSVAPSAGWSVLVAICLSPACGAVIVATCYYLLGRRGRRAVAWLYADQPETLSQRIRRAVDDYGVTSFRAALSGNVLVIHADGRTSCHNVATGAPVRDLDVPPAVLLAVTAPAKLDGPDTTHLPFWKLPG